MASLTLLPNNTWFKPNKTDIKKSTITSINIVDAYQSTGSEDDTWDASEDQDGTVTVYVTDGQLTISGNGSGKIYMNTDSFKMFSEQGTDADKFTELQSITGINMLDSSNVTTLERAFSGCGKLTQLDLSSWNVSKVTTMYVTFQSCTSLISLNVSGWDVSSVENMRNMFYNCVALSSLDVSEWDVSSVTTMHGMFGKCTSLSSLDISKWDVSSVTTMHSMFENCTSLTSLNVSEWDVSGVTDMGYTFNKCTSLSALEVSKWDVSNVTTMCYMFCKCTSLSSLDISEWDVSSVTDLFSFMCQYSYGDTSCSITELDLSKWDVSQVTNFAWAFYGMSKLEKINVSNWNTSKGVNFRHTFAHCKSLVDFDCSNWDVSNATSLDGFFLGTKKSKYDVSNWNTSKCVTIAQLFEACTNATEIIGLDKLNTSMVKKFLEMFQQCYKLRYIDMSNFDMRNIDDSWVDSDVGFAENATSNMFNSCTSLETLKLGEYCIIRENSAIPTPNNNNIPGADGNWYNDYGISFSPLSIPSETAGTYNAICPIVLVKGSVLHDIANAIREKNNSDTKYKPNEMADAIRALS